MDLTSRNAPRPPFPEIDPAEVARLVERNHIVDVREPHEFTGELGHVAGAELVPLATLEAAARGWDRDRPILVVCRSGARSGRGAATLVALGFSRITNLRGGMLAWREAGLPVEGAAAFRDAAGARSQGGGTCS